VIFAGTLQTPRGNRGSAGGLRFYRAIHHRWYAISRRRAAYSRAVRQQLHRQTAAFRTSAGRHRLCARRRRVDRGIPGNALGGNVQVIGNAEYYFPFPGLQKDKSVRLSAFFDVGMLGDSGSDTGTVGVDSNQARASVGLALAWFSPMGPLKISYAFPLNDQPDDGCRRSFAV
jgi:outer membrane protein assembly factor BamA